MHARVAGVSLHNLLSLLLRLVTSCSRRSFLLPQPGADTCCVGYWCVECLPWCAGQQITCAYNNGPNEVFLYRYGFVEIGNPHDVFESPALLQRIRSVELIPHSRFQRLKDLGLEDALSPARRFLPPVHFAFRMSPMAPKIRLISAQPEDMLAWGGGMVCLGLQASALS